MSNQEFGISEGNERIELSSFAKAVGINLIHFGISVLLGASGGERLFSPSAVAFCSSTKREYTLFSCLGGMLGYILVNDYVYAFRYVMALLMVYILKAYTHSFKRLRGRGIVPPVISLFSIASTGLAAAVATAFNPKDLFLCIAESATALAGAYFFTTGISSAEKLIREQSLTNRELTATIISTLIIILSARSIAIFSVSVSGIACSLIIMSASHLFREGGGAVMGTGTALGLLMTGSDDLTVFAFCVAGLFSGFFSYSGRVLCAFSYIFSYASALLLFNGNESDIPRLVETAIASVLFIIIPDKAFAALKARLSVSWLTGDGLAVQGIMLSRLKMVKNAVGDMSSTVLKVSQILKEKAAPDTTGVYLRVRDNVCNGCGSYDKCWRVGMPSTIGEFDELLEIIRKTGSVTPSATPLSLQSKCIHIMSLCDSFNKNYSSYSARLGAEGRINEMRKVTADQFDTVCEMLDDLLSDCKKGFKPLTSKSAAIKNSLEQLGASAFVSCYENDDKNTLVNITVDINCSVPEEKIRECIEKATEKVFAEPTVIKNESEKTLLLWEAPIYNAQCVYYQQAADETGVCGDCIDSFYDGKGNFIVVLSDGMGTGHRAAIDGAMTASLFSRLVIAGFSFPCALRLVNSAMLVKSREESLATLDIFKINLYNGEAVSYKAGATVSLLLRKGRVSEIKKPAMPIGILRQAEFATIRGGLKSDDVIIMMSDGAADSSLEEIKAYVSENGYSEELPKRLCAIARSRNISRCDDITVVAIKMDEIN